MNRNSKVFMKIVHMLEMSLAVYILICVAANGIYLIKNFPELIYMDSFQASYSLLEQLFAHILLLVIGLELDMMLVNHTTSAVIEVMLYAVARKMLIYTNTTLEMLIGVVALAGIFAIYKYLYSSEIGKEKKEYVYSENDILNETYSSLTETDNYEKSGQCTNEDEYKVKPTKNKDFL